MIIALSTPKMSAAIDTVGAQLISMKDENQKEYMWQRDPKYWSSCSPLLFPAIGNSRNGKTMIDGCWYDLPKHGFCRDKEFKITSQTASSVTLQVQDDDQTRQMYPYAFCLSLTYTLSKDELSVSYKVENRDSRPIAYCLGAHPGFQCPLSEEEAFEDYILEFEKEETADRIVYDLNKLQFDRGNMKRTLDKSRILGLKYSMFQQDAIYFEELNSRKVSLLNPKTGTGVEVSFPGFSSVAFWTPMNCRAPFLCIEPWNGSAVCSDEDDDFWHKNHVQTLTVSESRIHGLQIKILSSLN